MSPSLLETHAIQYAFDLQIDAPVDVVWKSLTDEIQEWWLPDFHMMGGDSIVDFEARAGGQLVERSETGGSLLWYTVMMAVPGESLDLVGHLAANYGGPSTSMLRIRIEASGDGTKVEFSDALFGRVSESSAASQEAGWKQLMGEGLKTHAEKVAG